MEDKAIVEIIGLSKSYGKLKALDNLNLNVNQGEIFGLLGPNGAGKSTLISILAAVSKPSKGEIRVDSQSMTGNIAKIKRRIGYVPQDIALYPTLSALNNLDFWAGIYGVRGKTKKESISQALMTVALEDRAKDRVEQYSGGMKRRLNIAVALLHKPDILVMDEPTVGVDIQSRKLILGALKNLKNEGKTIIIASHLLGEIESLCDRLAVLSKGKIVATGTVAAVKAKFGASSLEEAMLFADGTEGMY
jgi:ABC-2 type transport system ATP-binding protein